MTITPGPEAPNTAALDVETFDVIVIGAGVAGMCATARLTAEGMRVCLLERSRHLGGRASHRVRSECIVTTGAIMIPMGPDSTIREAFDALDIEMDMIDTTGKLRYRFEHGDYDLPPTGGGLYGLIEFAFNGDTEGAKALYGRFRDALTWCPPFDSITTEQWLAQYTDNEAVHGIFWGYTAALMGIGTNELRAGEFFRFLKGSSKGSRYGLAVEGNGSLMETLAAEIEARGSKIMRRSDVDQIIVEDDQVVGVRLEGDGTVLHSNVVMSSAGPDRTVELAGGESAFEASYVARLHTDSTQASIFHISFTLDEPLLPDLDGSMVFGNTENLIYLEIPSNISPMLAPPGVALHTAFGAPRDSTNVDYQGELENTLVELEQQFPGVSENADFLVKAMHRGRSPGMHRWAGFTMPVATPVKGLYCIGDGASAPGNIGTQGAASSAKLAVEHLLATR